MIWMVASETIEKTTFYPTVLGWMVVISGIGMFFGSTYLLLATNVGSRLGFLLVGAVASGFIMILGLLWTTTATPINVFKGRQAQWKAIAIVQSEKSSNIVAVQNIRTTGTKLSSTEYSNVKAAADTFLAAPKEGELPKPDTIINSLPNADVMVTDIYELGGSAPNPLYFQFRHTPQFAAAQFCQIDTVKAATAFRSTCDTSSAAAANNKVLIMEKDLGSLRQPPIFLFLGAGTLLGLFLLALHWREKDLKEAKPDNEEPTPSDDETPAPTEELVEA